MPSTSTSIRNRSSRPYMILRGFNVTLLEWKLSNRLILQIDEVITTHLCLSFMLSHWVLCTYDLRTCKKWVSAVQFLCRFGIDCMVWRKHLFKYVPQEIANCSCFFLAPQKKIVSYAYCISTTLLLLVGPSSLTRLFWGANIDIRARMNVYSFSVEGKHPTTSKKRKRDHKGFPRRTPLVIFIHLDSTCRIVGANN